MTDVFLINCPIAFAEEAEISGDDTSNPPLGLLYIAAYLEQNQISVKVLDVRVQKISLKDVLRKIKEESPKVVGLSAMTFSTRAAVKIALAIRKKFKRNRPVIALGGVHLSADPDFLRRFPVFDFGVVGEGEILFTRLVKQVLKAKKIRGLFYAKPITNLDKLPFPARHLINRLDYYGASNENVSDSQKLKTIYASLIGSRGCPFRCNFCSKPVHKTFFRTRSPENIFKEMESIHKDYDGKYIFMDDTTTLSRKNTAELCRLMIASGRKFRWMAMTRAGCVDRQLLKLMAKSGCHDLFFGVESGNERIRNEVIKKNARDKEIINAVSWCREYGIQTNLFLMLGFPEETMKEIEDTVNFGRRVQADLIGIHLTLPLPGSEIWELALKEGKVEKDLVDKYARGELGVTFKDVWPQYIPDGLTKEGLVQAKKRTYRHFYLDPRWLWRRLQYDFSHPTNLAKDIRLIKTGFYALFHGSTRSSMS